MPTGHRLAVEREFQGLRYHRLSHIHILAFDQVEYGARGFVVLQTHVYGVKHLKDNKNGIFYIYMLVRLVITVRASSSAKDESPPSAPETEDGLL